MGGWIMLHLARALGARVVGLVGVAAAPDFTRWGLELSAEEKAALARDGHIRRPSRYGDPYLYSAALVADGEASCLLDGPIPLAAPVRLLHGTADADVPVEIGFRLMAALAAPDVQLTLVKDGDHRLSDPAALALLERTVEALC
jgi:pimeloyl-ACP methyl ester carboxylesterase